MEVPDRVLNGLGVARPPVAHHEDSLAIAEHLHPRDLQRQLDWLQKHTDPTDPRQLLRRASFYFEYAIATPETEGDGHMFDLGHHDLETVLDICPQPRHQARIAASMILNHEVAYRSRADSGHIARNLHSGIQEKDALLLEEFFDGSRLTSRQWGQASELIAVTHLLETDHFPYLGLHREEANIITDDNHDLYTLHPCGVNGVKKSPGSVKYRQRIASEIVVPLIVGEAAVRTAQAIPPYSENEVLYLADSPGVGGRPSINKRAAAYATRLAGDIMICHVIGEELSPEDLAFKEGLTSRLLGPMVAFADQPTTPNYASNAHAITAEIMNRRAARMAQ